MSRAQSGQLRVEVLHSRSWRGFILALHAVAAAAVMMADMAWWTAMALLVGILLSLLWDLQRQAFPYAGLKHGLRTLVHHADGSFSLIGDGASSRARLLPTSRLWARILFLDFAIGKQKAWLVLPADALAAEDFRHLQARLRLSVEAE